MDPNGKNMTKARVSVLSFVKLIWKSDMGGGCGAYSGQNQMAVG